MKDTRRRLSLPRARAAIAALALSAFLLAPAGASGSRSQPTIFDGGFGLPVGNLLQLDQWVGEVERLGAEQIRLAVHWRELAPASAQPSPPDGFDPRDPADYPQESWRPLDTMVKGATRRGMPVLLTITGPVPDWASRSGRSHVAEPLPGAFGDFATAVGRRYDGTFVPPGPIFDLNCLVILCQLTPPLPRVAFWSVWNEPNLTEFLQPQFKHGRPYAPRIYRRLFVAAQAGLRASGHGGDQLLAGETSPTGGSTGLAPLTFARGVLCLNELDQREPGCAPLDAGGWAHHPYGYSYPPFRPTRVKSMINLGTMGRLTDTLDRAARVGATERRLDVYVTEFGVLTVPREFGVTLGQQVGWLAVSEYMAWRNPRIVSWAQYLLRDDSPGFASHFTSGLQFSNGRTKLAYRSFPITLMVRVLGAGRVLVWGHVRPGRGPFEVTVRVRDPGGRPHRLRRVRTSARGYFSFRSTAAPGRRWQAVSTLPGGRVVEGPLVRAYRFEVG